MTGLLLAGGRSTRMGDDKASIEFEGEPLARRALRVLSLTCDEVVVASGDGERMAWLGRRQVADIIPDAGPLGGLVAGLEAATTELVAVLAADMPFASVDVFRLLASRWAGEDAVVPRAERGLEPLHAVYARRAAAPLRTALESGTRALHEALRLLDALVVTEEQWRDADPSGRFAVNVNRPEDLESL